MVAAATGDVAAGAAVRVWAYLDDLLLIVPKELVGRSLDILFDLVTPTGYETNASKLATWCPHGRPPPEQSDPRLNAVWQDDGILVLGAPVGSLEDGDFSERQRSKE